MMRTSISKQVHLELPHDSYSSPDAIGLAKFQCLVMTHGDATAKQSASLEGLKEKPNANSGSVSVEGEVIAPNLEYERYLELHNEFDGPARKKFLRKRKLQMLRSP